MEHAILPALLVIEDELHGDARAARPIGLRRRSAIASKIARIIQHRTPI